MLFSLCKNLYIDSIYSIYFVINSYVYYLSLVETNLVTLRSFLVCANKFEKGIVYCSFNYSFLLSLYYFTKRELHIYPQ